MTYITLMFIPLRILAAEYKMNFRNVDSQEPMLMGDNNYIEYAIGPDEIDISYLQVIGKKLQAVGDEMNSKKKKRLRFQRAMHALLAVGFSYIVFRYFRT